MDRAQEPDGDYGYDMAHEALGTEPGTAPPQQPRGPSPAPDGVDPGTDLTYDESHDF